MLMPDRENKEIIHQILLNRNTKCGIIHLFTQERRENMRKLTDKLMIAMAAMSMTSITAFAAPIKQEELDTLLYGGVIMGGVIIYLVCGKAWNYFMSKMQKDKEKEKEE